MPKITIIGAGSVVFAKRLISDILSYPELEGSLFSLTDIDPVRLQTAEKMTRNVIEQIGCQANVEATLDRKQALIDADYVLNLIQVGMHEATLLDFEIPKKYGLKQTIADTLGVGAYFGHYGPFRLCLISVAKWKRFARKRFYLTTRIRWLCLCWPCGGLRLLSRSVFVIAYKIQQMS